MNPWSISFFRGILGIVLIGLLHQLSAVAQTETAQARHEPESTEIKPAESKDSMSEKRWIAIEEAFENLGNRKFGIRQAATQHLVNAGNSVLPELEKRALSSDVHIQSNCINIISAIGKEDSSLDRAVSALERLINDPNFSSAGKASEELTLLKKYQTNRAVRLLKEAGVHVSQNSTGGQVYSVSNLTEDGQCEHLKHLPFLGHLTLQGKGLTDACVQLLSKVPRLTTVYLNSTAISPAGIAEMQSIPNLTRLSLAGDFSAAHFRSLAEVKQLSSIHFQTQVGDEELTEIAALPVPEVVFARLTVTARTSEIMQTLKASRVQLTLNTTKDDDLKWLKSCKTLALNINIYNSKEVTDEGMRYLENANISTLSLYKTGITGKALEHIGAIKDLKTLSITNSPIDDASLKHLAGLQSLTSLRLQSTKVTGDGMATLKEKLENLRSMTPSPTRKIPKLK